MKVIMTESQREELACIQRPTSQFQTLTGLTTRFCKKLVIMLVESSSCLSSDDHVILSSADKPFALSPLSFPPH